MGPRTLPVTIRSLLLGRFGRHPGIPLLDCPESGTLLGSAVYCALRYVPAPISEPLKN